MSFTCFFDNTYNVLLMVGHTKLVKKCLLAGCAINKRMTPLNGITALHCAVRSDKNSEQVTQLLLQSGELNP